MKFKYFILSLTLISCGGYENQVNSTNNRIGEIVPLTTTTVADADKARVVSICNALIKKEGILNTAINSQHVFNASQTDCEGNNVGGGLVNVTIQQGAGGYVFKKTDGQDFIFPVETASGGSLADVCGAISNLTNPVVGESEVTFFTTTGINPNDCQADGAREICIQVRKANVQGSSAIIHTNEWLKVRVSSTSGKYEGFVLDRKKITRSYCGRNESLTYKATLQL